MDLLWRYIEAEVASTTEKLNLIKLFIELLMALCMCVWKNDAKMTNDRFE